MCVFVHWVWICVCVCALGLGYCVLLKADIDISEARMGQSKQ